MVKDTLYKFVLHLQSTTRHVMAKVALDQAIFAPVALSSFYIGLSLLEGKDRAAVYTEWRSKFPNTWAVSYTRGYVLGFFSIFQKQGSIFFRRRIKIATVKKLIRAPGKRVIFKEIVSPI
jgi:hypothetical protein